MNGVDYKEEIIQSRKGCLGSSDGALLAQIVKLGGIPKSAYRRMAEVKGLVEPKQVNTAAMRAGDEIEMAIFNHLKSVDSRWESNVRWESEIYSTKNCKLIAHPDLVRIDEETKTIYITEVKTTRYSFEETRYRYANQLYIELLIGNEIAARRGKDWKVKLSLCVYSTDGLNISDEGVGEFNPERIIIKQVKLGKMFDIRVAMLFVDEFLDTFTEYYDEEIVEAQYLPDNVRAQFEVIATTLREIKAREAEVNEFKEKLYEFLTARGVKKISCDGFSFTVVPPSKSVQFDGKRFIDDLRRDHPRKAHKIEEVYRKESEKKGYVKITVKEEETN